MARHASISFTVAAAACMLRNSVAGMHEDSAEGWRKQHRQSCYVFLSVLQVAPFSFMHVKPIGVLQMEDQGERDDKIIAVHLHDPAFRGFNDISELPAHRLMEVRSFFQDYKKNENKVRHARAPKGNLLLESWRSCRRSLPGSRFTA